MPDIGELRREAASKLAKELDAHAKRLHSFGDSLDQGASNASAGAGQALNSNGEPNVIPDDVSSDRNDGSGDSSAKRVLDSIEIADRAIRSCQNIADYLYKNFPKARESVLGFGNESDALLEFWKTLSLRTKVVLMLV